MTETDTIGGVTRPRGAPSPMQLHRLDIAREAKEEAVAGYKYVVVRILEEGCSFNEVSRATGLSKDTLQRWKREAGR